jgi:CRISPR-associated protein Cmr1
MELRLKTSTPLWTGGVEAGKVDRVHESGILGSLRWWMETLARGMGGRVSDPTEDDRSGFDSKMYKQSTASDKVGRLRDAGLCDVSQIFGATGWRRRFRLEIQDNTIPDNTTLAEIQAQCSYTSRDGKTRIPTWYFQSRPRSGNFVIRIQSLHPDFHPEIIAGLIQFVADWAAIGARPQMGFGVIEPAIERFGTKTLYDRLITMAGNQSYPDLPSLRNIFLAQIKPKSANLLFSEQTTFSLKYDLRRLFADDRKLRHFIMGTVEGGRMAAKIKVSRPYEPGLMRVWGWIPEKSDAFTPAWTRARVLDAIHQHLSTHYELHVWREMSSPRDSEVPGSKDTKAFLSNLLRLSEATDAA